MVITLGPGRFYGSGLPRPWFHSDVKFADERVDPPPPVFDPLLCWAREAHWSMGGLSFQRHRLQGRIEGSIKKLRAEAERAVRSVGREEKTVSRKRRLLSDFSDDDVDVGGNDRDEEAREDHEALVEIPTSTPRWLRPRRGRFPIIDADASNSGRDNRRKAENAVSVPVSPDCPRRKSARKLAVEFDKMAASRSPQRGKRQRI